jgi:pimeloyl-ACP methyl ester carboxylesterase
MKKHQMKAVRILLALACCLPEFGLATAFGQERNENSESVFRVISRTTDPSVTSPLRKIDTVVQVGGDARNRFTMHRVYKTGRHARRDHRGSIILAPPLLGNFGAYMLNENGDVMQSLAATLALANYAVYGYSPRTTGLPPNPCTTGAFDCSVMRDWSWSQAMLPDIDYIRRRAARDYPREKPAIGGFSRGGMLGVAAVNANPSGYSGLLLWDAILYSENPVVAAFNAGICSGHTANLAAGNYFNEFLPALVKRVTPISEVASLQFFGNPAPGLGTPTLIQLVPNSTRTAYEFASYARLLDLVAGLNNVEAIAGLRDSTCSFAGDRTFTANLASFTAPIFAIKQGQGFGPYMDDTINLTNSTNVRVQNNSAFGHLDAYLRADHATYVEEPILDWLGTDVFPDDDNDEN